MTPGTVTEVWRSFGIVVGDLACVTGVAEAIDGMESAVVVSATMATGMIELSTDVEVCQLATMKGRLASVAALSTATPDRATPMPTANVVVSW